MQSMLLYGYWIVSTIMSWETMHFLGHTVNDIVTKHVLLNVIRLESVFQEPGKLFPTARYASRIAKASDTSMWPSMISHRTLSVLHYAMSCKQSLFLNAKTHHWENSYALIKGHVARHVQVFQYAISCSCMQRFLMNVKTHDVDHALQLIRLESV